VVATDIIKREAMPMWGAIDRSNGTFHVVSLTPTTPVYPFFFALWMPVLC